MRRRKLGDLLCEAGLIDRHQLGSALAYQRQWGGKLGRILVQMRLIDEATIAQTLARQLELGVVQLAGREIDESVLRLVPQAFCETHQVLPYALERDERGVETLHVAMVDPTNLAVVDEIAFLAGRRVVVAVTTDSDLDLAIRHHFYGEAFSDQLRGPTDISNVDFSGHDFEFVPVGYPIEERDHHPVAPPVAGSGDILELREEDLIEEPQGLGPERRQLLHGLAGAVGVPVEGPSDRQLLDAVVRVLIRKGVLTGDEIAAELRAG